MAVPDGRDIAETFPVFDYFRPQSRHLADEHDLRGSRHHVFLADAVAFVILYDIVEAEEFQILVHERAFDDRKHRIAAYLEKCLCPVQSLCSLRFPPVFRTGQSDLIFRSPPLVCHEPSRNPVHFRPFPFHQGFRLRFHPGQTAYFHRLLADFIKGFRRSEILHFDAQVSQPLLHLRLGEHHAEHDVGPQCQDFLQIHFQYVAYDFARISLLRKRAEGRAAYDAGIRPHLLQIVCNGRG